MITSNVLKSLNNELDFALVKYGSKDRSVGEHLLIVEKYFLDAKQAWQNHAGDNRALHELRKLAAMVLQCLNEHGCPERCEPYKNGDGQEDLIK